MVRFTGSKGSCFERSRGVARDQFSQSGHTRLRAQSEVAHGEGRKGKRVADCGILERKGKGQEERPEERPGKEERPGRKGNGRSKRVALAQRGDRPSGGPCAELSHLRPPRVSYVAN